MRIHDEDGSLWATVDEVPGCFAAGETMDELTESLREGLSLALSSKSVDVSVHIEALESLRHAQTSPGAVRQERLALS